MLFAVATTTRASRTTSAALEAQEGAAVRVAVASAATTVAAEEEEAEKRPCARSNLRDHPRASSSASKTNTCSDCKTVVPSTSCSLLTIHVCLFSHCWCLRAQSLRSPARARESQRQGADGAARRDSRGETQLSSDQQRGSSTQQRPDAAVDGTRSQHCPTIPLPPSPMRLIFITLSLFFPI